MTSGRQAAERKRPAPRLYLVTQRIDDAGALVRPLETALGAADVAAVLLRLGEADERTLIKRVKALAPVVQGRNVALLLEGHAEIVARAGADGAHLSGCEALSQALPGLKPDRIAGAGGLETRHDAMLAGEAGADYVMFGEPAGTDGRPPFGAIVDRVAWWTEVFEVPCVGYAASIDEAAALAQAGAEFVALGDFVWSDQGGPAAAVAATARRLSALELA
jgi:thiamine-phosphate pyrophosphorylase